MLFVLISCMGFNENTVWLVELSSEISGDCSSTLEHNFFVEYESDDEDYVSDWTYTYDNSSSNSLSLFQTSNKLSSGLLLIGGNLIPGTKENGVWTYTWKNTDYENEESRHVSSFVHIYEREVISKYTVTFDTKEKTGTYQIKTTSTTTEYETDTWDDDELYNSYGDINTYVVGVDRNYSEEEDCISDANMCTYTKEEQCDINMDFTATKTSLDSIDGFEYYDNPSGSISTGFDTGW